MKKFLAIGITIVGLASIILGVVFIQMAAQKEAWMRDAAALEKVTLGLNEEQIKSGQVVDSSAEMQAAADVLREHRRSIAPTYNDLLKGGRYDPTNPQHLTYAQALNMENYLYLGVLGFGVTQIVTVTGAFMIVVGLAIGAAGMLLYNMAKKTVAAITLTRSAEEASVYNQP